MQRWDGLIGSTTGACSSQSGISPAEAEANFNAALENEALAA
jgi:hypothetical protein